MISVNEFLHCIQENVNRITHYELGGDGSGGGCDCIGLIIGALALAGEKWNGTHGSNWAARNAVEDLCEVKSAAGLRLGDVVFKAKEPGESGYDLPGAYKDGSDQRDYYHVGVVTSVDPLCITHCTGVPGGIKVDNALGQWRWAGWLKEVAEDDAPDTPCLYQAVVTADNGYPVKMRSGPGKHYDVLASVPLGAVVDVLSETDDTWARIQYGGQKGYMMRKFLKKLQDNAVSLLARLRAIRADLEAALQAVNAAIREVEPT